MTPVFSLAAAAIEESKLETITRTFGWNPQLFVSQIIVFAIVVFCLKKYAFGPIQQLLDERRNRIEEGLANAEKIKTELTQAEATRKAIMEKASNQATQMIEEARAAAARVQEQETQKAIVQAEMIVTKAQEATRADHAKMLAELKKEIGRLVVQTTAHVAGKVLTDDDQKRLIEEANRQIAA